MWKTSMYVLKMVAKDFTPARENPVSIEVVFADDTLSLTGVDNSNVLGTDPRFKSLFVGYPREIDGDYMRGRVGVLTLQNVSEGFVQSMLTTSTSVNDRSCWVGLKQVYVLKMVKFARETEH